MKQFWKGLLLAAVLWNASIVGGECAVTEVTVDPIGVMQIATGVQAETAKELEAAQQYPAIRAQYDLTMQSGDVWHYSRLLICREENKLG